MPTLAVTPQILTKNGNLISVVKGFFYAPRGVIMASDTYAFTWENIQNAPAQAGVYALFDGDEIIYIGRAQGGNTTIRSRLSAHKNGNEGSCTQFALAYWRETTSRPVSREKELLEWFKGKHGRLPRCNSRIG